MYSNLPVKMVSQSYRKGSSYNLFRLKFVAPSMIILPIIVLKYASDYIKSPMFEINELCSRISDVKT